MSFIVNLIAKISGLSAILGRVDGFKTYIAGSALFLSGLVQLLNEILLLKDAAGWVAFAQHLSSDQAVIIMAQGLTALGLRHALAKQDASTQ